MTFDGNPKPVQFIEPNVLDRACLSVGKHDGCRSIRIASHFYVHTKHPIFWHPNPHTDRL